jgi:hypothetical protein
MKEARRNRVKRHPSSEGMDASFAEGEKLFTIQLIWVFNEKNTTGQFDAVGFHRRFAL